MLDKPYRIENTEKGLKLVDENNKSILLKTEYGLHFMSEDDGKTWINYLVSKECPHCQGTGKIYE